jgi:hypothetical protein
MLRKDLEGFVGKIVCLDLVNRERPVCRIVSVTDTHVKIKNPFIYVPVQVGTSMQVQAISYAAPLFEVKELDIELQHIVSRLELQPQMEQAYIRQTSGVITDTKPSIIVP